MLSVMPMEPTRPMPRRSSGTKDMADACSCGWPWGSCRSAALGRIVVGIVIGNAGAALAMGCRPAMASSSSFWPVAGNTGNAQDLAAVDGRS